MTDTTPALCVLRHKEPAEATHGRVCAHHSQALREALQDVIELFALSRLFLLPGSIISDGSKHTKAAEAPAPIRLEVAALSDRRNPATVPMSFAANYDWAKNLLVNNGPDIPDIPGTLEDWAGWVTDERELTPLAKGWTITQSVQRLHAHLAWITAQELVVEFEESLRDMRRALAHAAGEKPAEPVGRCPSLDGDGRMCNGPLWPRRDVMAVDCGRCARHYDEPFLRHLGGMMSA